MECVERVKRLPHGLVFFMVLYFDHSRRNANGNFCWARSCDVDTDWHINAIQAIFARPSTFEKQFSRDNHLSLTADHATIFERLSECKTKKSAIERMTVGCNYCIRI